MASGTATDTAAAAAVTEDMELENPQPASNAEDDSSSKPLNGDSNSKRERVDLQEEAEDEAGAVSKKQKVENSVEEERLEKLEVTEDGNEEEGKEEKEGEKSGPVSVGPKSFGSSVEMFDYFFNFLHHWPPNVNVNKYEHMMLLDLIKKGHLEPDKKIGPGVHAFQIRYHPMWKSRCFFLIRTDESVDDFSFRKCVDHILPLPDHMKLKPDVNKAFGAGGRGHGNKGGGGRGGGRGRGRGHGRGGKSRR
ncbi:hypothetical protein Ancab_038882 [Ancistrocladus abbreviatus]